MPVRSPQSVARLRRALGAALRVESGFTMIIALSVLMITSLLTASVFLVVQGDATVTRADLDGKRAYTAAQAGLQAYVYQLNNNSTNSAWWGTCSNDTVAKTAVLGTSTATQYSYAPVPANGKATCLTTDPVGTLIDSVSGSLRMKFTGYSRNTTRTIVASLRTLSPLSFLWYTVHETVDTAIGGPGCATFYYQGSGPPNGCYILWVTGDKMNGPLYTQDQLLINNNAAPVFGRSAQDTIASQAPTTSVCAAQSGTPPCQNASFLGQQKPNVTQQVPLPSDNSNLLQDAVKNGLSLSGTTTLTVSGTSASGWNCPSAVAATTCTAVSIPDLRVSPIFYATNAAGCNASYTPTNVSYPLSTGTTSGHAYGPCGDIYVSGTYSTPLTIAAADNVIVTGDLTTTEDTSGNPTGTSTLGLVANQYVRVKHDCTGNPARTIDAAILTLQHSFFVDNYDCGGSALGTLTVHGAIAQYFRGIVGQVGSSGYLKNYNYDDRLGVILPPYLFDLQKTQWTAYRETLCSTAAGAPVAISCG